MKRVLEANGLAMSRKFGQNFLLPSSIRERIVGLTGLNEGDEVWEIGPGLGSLTGIMLSRGMKVKAFEIDHGFCRILSQEAFADEPGFTLVEGDAMKTVFSEGAVPSVVCGNLPYNVGSVLIGRMIEKGLLPQRMVFTLQKEVVERMCANVGDESYSSFSILTQLDYTNSCAMTIARSCFYPAPNVDSAVVLMERRRESLVEDDLRQVFLETVSLLFSQRRKTIRNNLSRLGRERADMIILDAGLTGQERAEALPFSSLVELARSVRKTEGSRA